MQVHIKTKINAPAEKVWQILAHQFDDIATWSSIVNESRRLSAGEIPAGFTPAPSAPVLGRETVSPALKAKEIITHYSEEKMELTFEAADLPPIMTYADDVQRVIPNGPNQCIVTFDIRMEPWGPLKIFNPILKGRFAKTMGGVQQDLKQYAETGQAA